MDPHNPVVALCVLGSQAELQGRPEEAHALYLQAWETAQDDYEACIAAHYVARHQQNAAEKLRWNRIALDKATAVDDDLVEPFYPSLYLCMGESYELLGDAAEAERYYALSADLGAPHQPA